jgi:hypothetical protein
MKGGTSVYTVQCSGYICTVPTVHQCSGFAFLFLRIRIQTKISLRIPLPIDALSKLWQPEFKKNLRNFFCYFAKFRVL